MDKVLRVLDRPATSAANRFIRFPAGLTDDYFEQLTSEVWDSSKSRYRKLPGRSNEVIDLFVYAFAAAYHPLLRLDVMRDADWAQLEAMIEPVNGDLFRQSLLMSEEQNAAPHIAEQDRPAAEIVAAENEVPPAPAMVASAPVAQPEQPPDSDWLSGTDNWLD